jgi:hypothetical protein
MVPILELWLPIVVAAVVVTLAAAILWRVTPAVAPPGRAAAPPPALGTSLGLQFLYALVIGVLVAYLVGRTVDPAEDYKAVFRVAATAGILAYSFGALYGAIQGARPWPAAWRDFLHGVAFGLLTGGPFGWLWPGS